MNARTRSLHLTLHTVAEFTHKFQRVEHKPDEVGRTIARLQRIPQPLPHHSSRVRGDTVDRAETQPVRRVATLTHARIELLDSCRACPCLIAGGALPLAGAKPGTGRADDPCGASPLGRPKR